MSGLNTTITMSVTVPLPVLDYVRAEGCETFEIGLTVLHPYDPVARLDFGTWAVEVTILDDDAAAGGGPNRRPMWRRRSWARIGRVRRRRPT
jgi:hypothetical protein